MIVQVDLYKYTAKLYQIKIKKQQQTNEFSDEPSVMRLVDRGYRPG